VSFSSSPDSLLKRGDFFVLFAVALVVGLVLIAIQPVPGYMDADYYYAGGLQLAGGHGFNDAFIWNFLDQPAGLPHPSNSYWYPLASLVAAGGMLLTGHADFISARLGFLAMMALAPLVVAALAWRISLRRQTALLAGFLTIFSGYYLPFVVTTDNYSLYLFAGALYFLLLDRLTYPRALLLGLLAGALNLARGDGILWLPITLAAVMLLAFREVEAGRFRIRGLRAVSRGLAALLGYLMVMGAWFARNQVVFGSLLPPGSSHVLWMTSYNQIYSFTPQMYTFRSWLASGWQTIGSARLHALWQNLTTGFFAEGSILLMPLIVVGAWKTWRSFRTRLAVFGWLAMLLAESFLFPYASVNGGFFHAGTAFQPLWFVLAALGLDAALDRLFRGQRNLVQKAAFSRVLLVLLMVLFSVLLVKIRVYDRGWTEGEYAYQKADRFLVAEGAHPQDIVLVRNPPAYFIMTGRQTVVIPYGGVPTLLAAARKYGARYVFLEAGVVIQPLEDLYNHPEAYPQFTSLGYIDDNLLLSIKLEP
jgi:hypothetical protein